MSDLESLKKEREKWITRIFFLSLEIAFIFLIPALIAVFFAKRMGEGSANIIFLSMAFTFSWLIVILRYRSISKKMKSIDIKIKEKEKERK